MPYYSRPFRDLFLLSKSKFSSVFFPGENGFEWFCSLKGSECSLHLNISSISFLGFKIQTFQRFFFGLDFFWGLAMIYGTFLGFVLCFFAFTGDLLCLTFLG